MPPSSLSGSNGEKMKNSGLITIEYVNTVIKERPRDIHKGDCGKVLVIAGSKGMAGAAVLCARGALRSGAGLVGIAAPEELYTILQTGVPEATCVSRDISSLDLTAYDAIAIGPGLGDDKKNAKIISTVLSRYEKTIVLDADGINTISRHDLIAELRETRANVIITPHYGEAVRLLEYCRIPKLKDMDRLEIADHLARETGTVAILKGQDTVVAMKENQSYINTTGNPGMATGGSGDVLTGIIAALGGQGINPLDSAKAGVFVHGLAGDLCADSFGETGMTSLDIANMTALAFKKVIGK